MRNHRVPRRLSQQGKQLEETTMAVKRNDPYKSDVTNDDTLRRRAARLDNELQPDPELAEGRAGNGRIVLFAIAIVAIIGVVFYGLNNPSITPTTSTAQTTTTAPSTPVTPPAGQTTGSTATSPTSPPPASTPPAVDQPANNSPNNSPSDTNSGSTNMTPAPSPSNGGTTQSGPPANN